MENIIKTHNAIDARFGIAGDIYFLTIGARKLVITRDTFQRQLITF